MFTRPQRDRTAGPGGPGSNHYVLAGAMLLAGCPDDDGNVTTTEGGGSGTTMVTTATTMVTTATTGPADTGVDVTGVTTAGTGGGGGGECTNDSDCEADEVCVDAPSSGQCVCAPGLVLCGESCVDIRVDVTHCGRCFDACDLSDLCIAGRCSSDSPLPPGPFAEPPRQVSPGDPTMECTYANEAKPERSINGGAGSVDYWSAFQRDDPANQGWNSWTADAVTWDTSLRQTEFVPGEFEPVVGIVGDSWTTTHGGTGLEYAAYIANTVADGYCIAVAATTPGELQTNDWAFPGTCARPPDPAEVITDAPVVYADLGTDAILLSYVASIGQSPMRLIRYWPCTTGSLGDEMLCPIQWHITAASLLQGHPNVVINPCTHHAFALFRSTGEVRLTRFSVGGDQLGQQFVVDTDAIFEGNTNCFGGADCNQGQVCKCGGAGECDVGNDCMRVVPRAHAAVYQQDADSCYLYVAYDRSETATDNESYMKVRLRVLDISDEDNIVFGPTVDSTAPGPGDALNDFNASVAIDYFTGAAGLFFYRQENGDPCTTTYRGMTSTGIGLPFVDLPAPISGPFPSMHTPFAQGIGDYVETSRLTEPGYVLTSWGEPVITQQAPCVPCQGDDYALAVMATRVRP